MTTYAELIHELSKPDAIPAPDSGFTPSHPQPTDSPPPEPTWKEIVVDANGQPRQAGATQAEGEAIIKSRILFENSLHAFGKGVMGRSYFTADLHLPIANWLQKTPPYRKMLLIPRGHGKTSIISHCLPPHILIQPAATNIYFPGLEGCECRILLGGSSAGRAEKNLGVISKAFTTNTLMRALWPHRCYESARHANSNAPKWNAQEIVIPREENWPDASVFAVGVGVEVAGARPNVMIKDDLVGREAANSDAMMRDAIDWHVASRALFEEYERESGVESLEFILGTRWAVFDLYAFIMQGDGDTPPDYSVEPLIRSILEPILDAEGNDTGELAPIWPERWSLEKIEELRKKEGSMFYLQRMNQASDPNLVDFDLNQVRRYTLGGPAANEITFDETNLDAMLEERWKAKPEEVIEQQKPPQGIPLNADTWDYHFGKGRGMWMRFKSR